MSWNRPRLHKTLIETEKKPIWIKHIPIYASGDRSSAAHIHIHAAVCCSSHLVILVKLLCDNSWTAVNTNRRLIVQEYSTVAFALRLGGSGGWHPPANVGPLPYICLLSADCERRALQVTSQQADINQEIHSAEEIVSRCWRREPRLVRAARRCGIAGFMGATRGRQVLGGPSHGARDWLSAAGAHLCSLQRSGQISIFRAACRDLCTVIKGLKRAECSWAALVLGESPAKSQPFEFRACW